MKKKKTANIQHIQNIIFLTIFIHTLNSHTHTHICDKLIRIHKLKFKYTQAHLRAYNPLKD